MAKRLVSILALILGACNAPPPIPKSLCALPRNMSGWVGYDVHWQGMLLTSGHGIIFIAEDCPRRGLPIAQLSTNAAALYWAHHGPKPSDWEIDMTAKIVSEGLYIQAIHRLDPIDGDESLRRVARLGF